MNKLLFTFSICLLVQNISCAELLVSPDSLIEQAAQAKSAGYLNLGTFASAYAISEGNGNSWYPNLKAAIDNFLRASELFLQAATKLKKKDDILSKVSDLLDEIKRYLNELNQEDSKAVLENLQSLFGEIEQLKKPKSQKKY